jgi:hypothetical protein
MNHQALSALIGSVADLLRGDFKPSENRRVVLPFSALRRLHCVLAAAPLPRVAPIPRVEPRVSGAAIRPSWRGSELVHRRSGSPSALRCSAPHEFLPTNFHD